MKYLISYFSRTGNTKKLAEKIHAITNFDIYEIKPKNPYPTNFLWACFTAGKQYLFGTKVDLANEIPTLDDYEGIFIGYPIWCGHLPQITHSFAELLKSEGKKIIPFCTDGSDGLLNTEEELKNCCPGTEILKGYAIKGTDSDNINDDSVKEWLRNLKIID